MNIEKIQNNLKSEIRKAKEARQIKDDLQGIFKNDVKNKDNLAEVFQVKVDHKVLPKKFKRELTNEEAKNLSKLQNNLHQTFKKSIDIIRSGEDAREKQFHPITHALEKVETAIEKVNKGIEKTDTDILALVPKRKIPEITESSSIPDTPMIRLGSIAKDYISKAKDPKFGIWYDSESKSHKIGKLDISFDGNDIIMNDKKYNGTTGLWMLLTSEKEVDKELFSDEDYYSYVSMLKDSDSIYQNNDKNSNKPKSSVGLKYNNMIKPIYNYLKRKQENPTTKRLNSPYRGAGLIKYNENPIEYKYINNLNELLKRLYYIASQEQAGNNNFHNEKLGIVNFFANELEKLIDSPRGIEYLISYVSSLPKKMIKGDGLLNDLINNLPFELHWPKYNFLGPGTKLDERLARNDKPINKLDEAAKEHDIFYKQHKDTKTRNKADHVLENKAWERVLNPESHLINEKVPAWITTNVMKVKRTFGMGLK